VTAGNTTVLQCGECKKRYRFQGAPDGRALRCPECGAPLKAVGAAPLRSQLRDELARLSAVEALDPAARTRVRVAERARRPLSPWMLWGAAALLLALVGAGGWWAYARAHRGPPELSEAVRSAIRRAQLSDVPGHEEQALSDWTSARGFLLTQRVQQKVPDAFHEEAARMHARIRELQEIVRRRRAGLPPLQNVLAEARMALEDGRSRQAVEALEGLLPKIAEADVPETDRERFRAETEGLLMLARTAAAAAPAPASAAPASTRPARPRRRPVPEAVAPASGAAPLGAVIDAPGEALLWRAESWANPATVSVEPGAAVMVRQEAGLYDKWAISLVRALDASGHGRLAFDLQSPRPVRVAVALWTGTGGATMFESAAETVRGGGWREVVFPLTGPRFKCLATKWQFGGELKDPESVGRITLLFYDNVQAPLRIRNVRLVP